MSLAFNFNWRQNIVFCYQNEKHNYNKRGWHAVAQLVEALRYKPEGRGFYSRWGYWLKPHYDPGVNSASNRNEYQEYFLRGGGG
jgi:hypothetical protein